MPNKGEMGRWSGCWPWLAAFSAFALVLPLFPRLPAPWLVASALLLAFLLLAHRPWRRFGWLMLAGVAVVQSYSAALDGRLESYLPGQVTTATGTVASLPEVLGDRVRFRFETDTNDAGVTAGQTVLVSWYRDWPDIRFGERWRLVAGIKPPWGRVNFDGPDRERWLFSQGIDALASVRSGERLASVDPGFTGTWIQHRREDVRDAILRQVPEPGLHGPVLALAIADRSAMDAEMRERFRITGTAHLMAISGLHVGLAALFGLVLGRWLGAALPMVAPGAWVFRSGLLVGAVTATAYALLAGLGVSTLRALLMSLAGFVAISASRAVHPMGALLLVLAAVLLLAPRVSLGAGFWFSFLAVFALASMFTPRTTASAWWRIALSAQGAVFVVLLAANAAWLGGISLSAFPANLLAIPWVSFTVVPAVLAGVLALSVSEPLAGMLWSAAGYSMVALHYVLAWLEAAYPALWVVRPPGVWQAVAATAGGLVLLLPRGLPGRWLGLFLIAPLVLPVANPVTPGGMRVEALDAGQGSAILLTTQRHVMLYDTGAGDGAGRDSVASVISPALAAMGRAVPDRVVLSHGDLDHTGGLHSLRLKDPDIPVLGSVAAPTPGIEKCEAGQAWSVDGHRFRVLHPSTALPYLRNNSSCVLAMEGGGADVLLPGDIDHGIERRLLLDGLGSHDILFAPHHGSASSSSREFLERVDPKIAIATAGLGNRFGFPRAETRQQYAEKNIPLWSTGECGGIRLDLHPDGAITATSARKQRPRFWRWPATPDCP